MRRLRLTVEMCSNAYEEELDWSHNRGSMRFPLEGKNKKKDKEAKKATRCRERKTLLTNKQRTM